MVLREGVERVGVAADGSEQRQDHEGGEEDGDPGRAAARVDPGEHRGQDPLVPHAVDDPGGHDHVDQRPVGDRDERDEREQSGSGSLWDSLHYLEQRSARRGELGRRHHHRGGEGDEQVDDAGGEQAAEDRARVDPARVPHLLGHVDRVVEADQGVERQDRAGQDGGKYARALLELEGPGRLAVPAPSATIPITTISTRPVISTHVKIRLSLTDSEMP